MTSLLEGITRYMPYYYDYKNTEKYGNILITPKEGIRKILKIGEHGYIPYFAEDEIEFTLQIEKIAPPEFRIVHYPRVYQRIGDGRYREGQEIRQTTPVLIKGKADYTGSTKFFFGPGGLKENGILIERQCFVIYSEDIIHRDLITREIFLMLSGASCGGILGCIAGVVAGVIASLILAFVFGIGIGK